MPKIVVTHDVDDVAHWLASPKRAELMGDVVSNLQTYVRPGDSNNIAISMEVTDMEAFEAILKSEEGAAAMKHDGVRPETIVVYIEG